MLTVENDYFPGLRYFVPCTIVLFQTIVGMNQSKTLQSAQSELVLIYYYCYMSLFLILVDLNCVS